MTLDKIADVSVALKANIYFDGKVVSHTVYDKMGSKKTLGLIYPGSYSFNTDAPELMVITGGKCEVKLKGENKFSTFAEGSEFRVPGKSSFEIAVKEGIAQYLCVFES